MRNQIRIGIRTVLLLVILAVAFAGCATKRYTIATPVSASEAAMLNCEILNLEMVRADQIEKQINETGQFDGRTMLGFLGDFGIGNGMAKEEARSALAERRRTIREAQVSKGCINIAADSVPNQAATQPTEDAAKKENAFKPADSAVSRKLKELQDMQKAGLITEVEYTTQRTKILEEFSRK